MNSLLEEGLNFPIEKITTSLTKKELIVKEKTFVAIQNMESLLRERISSRDLNNTSTETYSGMHVIFTGPSGTGKTLAATLVGNEIKYDVYRINLSKVVAKYIGETEKNLDKILSRAETSKVILLFDEADALFGKRTEVRNSHDRYAKLEVSWLLQRIDTFNGISILAFNKPVNTGSPFFKRFDLIVEFEKPDSNQRLKLWRNYLPFQLQQEMEPDVYEIARKYKLTGGEIVNAIRTASEKNLNAITRMFMNKNYQNKM